MNKYWAIRQETQENINYNIWGFHQYMPISLLLSIWNQKYTKDDLINFLNLSFDYNKASTISNKINHFSYNLNSISLLLNLEQKNNMSFLSSQFNQFCFMYSYLKNVESSKSQHNHDKLLSFEKSIMDIIDQVEEIFSCVDIDTTDHLIKVENFNPIILN